VWRERALRSRAADPASQPEVIASRLLPMLFEGIEPQERIIVLDVGCGMQSTVDFFAHYNARIHFVDLFSSSMLVAPPEEIDADGAYRIFADYLNLAAEVTFDICLFWDVLHRVDLPVLQGLSRALHPHLRRGTRGYAFGTLHANTFDHRRYGISDIDHLAASAAAVQGRFFAHTQKQISEQFGCFAIERATLLRTGRLELLLGAD